MKLPIVSSVQLAILPLLINASSTSTNIDLERHQPALQSILNQMYTEQGRPPVLGFVSGEECIRTIYSKAEQLDWRSASQWAVATRVQKNMINFLLSNNFVRSDMDMWGVLRVEESFPPSPKLMMNSVFYSFIINNFDLNSLRLLTLMKETKLKLIMAILIEGKVDLLYNDGISLDLHDLQSDELQCLVRAALLEPRAASVDALHNLLSPSHSSSIQFNRYLAQAAIVHDHLVALRYLSLHFPEYFAQQYSYLIAYAVRFGRCRPLNYLLNYNQNNALKIVNSQDDVSALEEAITTAMKFDNFEAIRFLLMDGNEPRRLPIFTPPNPTLSLATVLRNAVGLDCHPVVDLLLQHRPKENKNYNIPSPDDNRLFNVAVGPDLLTVAIKNNQLEMLKYLLQRERSSANLLRGFESGAVVQETINEKNLPILAYLLTDFGHYWQMDDLVGQWALLATELDFLPGLSLILSFNPKVPLNCDILDPLFHAAFNRQLNSILAFLTKLTDDGQRVFPKMTAPYCLMKDEDNCRDQLVKLKHDVVWMICKWINPKADSIKFHQWNSFSKIQRHKLLEETFSNVLALNSSCYIQ